RHETNMLFVRVGEAQAAALGDYLRERNILINAAPIVRLVTHLVPRYSSCTLAWCRSCWNC
ncbi:hypothetical protein MJN54_33030, partial [Salmonella enterica subsp. enterica serovar Kentucky]|nr:hypothetical protein [Salmonella enterica subsp. enterica serovar Kentucky]